jgi:hypothetical protein
MSRSARATDAFAGRIAFDGSIDRRSRNFGTFATKKANNEKNNGTLRDLFAKISRYRARAYGRAVSKNRRGKKSGVGGEKHPQIAETIDERARDAPVYVARTATARARLRRETREGARKPAGRVVGWIFGKSRVSEAERRGGERNDAA